MSKYVYLNGTKQITSKQLTTLANLLSLAALKKCALCFCRRCICTCLFIIYKC